MKHILTIIFAFIFTTNAVANDIRNNLTQKQATRHQQWYIVNACQRYVSDHALALALALAQAQLV